MDDFLTLEFVCSIHFLTTKIKKFLFEIRDAFPGSIQGAFLQKMVVWDVAYDGNDAVSININSPAAPTIAELEDISIFGLSRVALQANGFHSVTIRRVW